MLKIYILVNSILSPQKVLLMNINTESEES